MIRIVGGEIKPGAKVNTVKGFSEAEVRKLKIPFNHRKTVCDAFKLINKLR